MSNTIIVDPAATKVAESDKSEQKVDTQPSPRSGVQVFSSDKSLERSLNFIRSIATVEKPRKTADGDSPVSYDADDFDVEEETGQPSTPSPRNLKIQESDTTAPPEFKVASPSLLLSKDDLLEPLHSRSFEEKVVIRRISPLRTFNRMLDAFFKAPVFLLHGNVEKLRPDISFTRDVDSVNTMRPNLITVVNNTAEFWAPSSIKKIDLNGKTHHIGEAMHEKFMPEMLRINLFCGLKLWMLKSDFPDYQEKAFVFVRNCRDLDFDAMGVIAGLSHESLKKHLRATTLKSEPELLLSAMTAAQKLEVEFNPRFYEFPEWWIRDLTIPREVRAYLMKFRGRNSPITSVRGIPDTDFFKNSLEVVAQKPGPDQERAKLCLELLQKAPPEVQNQILEQSKAFVQGEFPPPGLQPICSTAELRKRTKEKTTLLFSFEGQDYAVEAPVLSEYEPVPQGYRPYFIHGSLRLNSALDLASQRLERDLKVSFVHFQIQLPSSCTSVITRSGKNEHGFSRRGYSWQEKYELQIEYAGPWFEGDQNFVESLNNQLLAEMINLKTQLCLAWAPRLQLYDISVDSLPRYLDAFDVDVASGEVLPSVYADLTEHPVSGFSKLIEKELLKFLLQHSERVRFPNVRNYIWGFENPRLILFDQDGRGSCEYFYTKGDRLDQPPDQKAHVWVKNIHSRTTLDGHLPSPADDFTVDDDKRAQIPLSKSGPPSQKSQKAKVEEMKVEPSAHWPGNWLSQKVFELPVSVRMYAASRAYDRFKERSSKYHEGISQEWSKTLLQFLPQPVLTTPIGHQKNYYLPPSGVKLPKWFLEGHENATQKESFREIPDVEIPPKGSRLHRFGRDGKPSPFHY